MPLALYVGSKDNQNGKEYVEIAQVVIVKLGFHSNISFVAGETFLSEDQKNKLYPKFLQVINETVVTDD